MKTSLLPISILVVFLSGCTFWPKGTTRDENVSAFRQVLSEASIELSGSVVSETIQARGAFQVPEFTPMTGPDWNEWDALKFFLKSLLLMILIIPIIWVATELVGDIPIGLGPLNLTKIPKPAISVLVGLVCLFLWKWLFIKSWDFCLLFGILNIPAANYTWQLFFEKGYKSFFRKEK